MTSGLSDNQQSCSSPQAYIMQHLAVLAICCWTTGTRQHRSRILEWAAQLFKRGVRNVIKSSRSHTAKLGCP
eukprot:3411315-Amphidinium_carterae.1